MSLERKEMYTCKNCRKDFEITMYDSINVQLNPELREKLINQDMFIYTCPHCGAVNVVLYPVLYNDMKNRFMVYFNKPGNLMLTREEMMESNERKMFGELFDSITRYGASDYYDFITKIVALENGYDPRVIACMLAEFEQGFNRTMQRQNKNMKVLDLFLTYTGDNEVSFVGVASENNTDSTTFSSPLIQEMYDDMQNNCQESFEHIYDFVFNRASGEKLMSYKTLEECNAALKKKQQFCLVKTDNDNVQFALIPSFNKGQFKIGDTVILYKENECSGKGKILRILEMSEFACPFKIEGIPTVM